MRNVLRVSLLTLMAVSGFSMFLLCVPAMFTQHDLSHPESIMPWAVRQIAAGEPLYSDWRQWPHRFMPYGPMLCYPIGLLFRALQMDEFGFHLYLAGRLQSFFYMVGTAALMANMLRIAGLRYGWAILYAFAYLSLWTGILISGMSFRGDLPSLFWALAAATVAFGFSNHPWKTVVVLACLMLSLAYRPALWAFPAAYAIFTFFRHGIGPALKWCVAVVIAVALYATIGNVATDGRFLLNQVGASSIGLTTEIYKLAFQVLTGPQDFPILTWDWVARLVLAAGAAIALIIKSRSDFDRGLSIYYLSALAVNMVTMFKVGAGFNYLAEAFLLAGVILGIAAIRLSENWNSVRTFSQRSAIVAGGVLFIIPMLYFTTKNFSAVPRHFRSLSAPAVYEPLARLPSTALLADLAFIHPDESTHYLSDAVPYVQLMRRGRISPEPFTSRIAAHAFSHIVLSPGMKYLFYAPDRAPQIGEALDAHYKQETVVPEYEIWVPQKSEVTSSTETTAPSISE